MTLDFLKIDSKGRRVDLDPRAAQFYQNPYPAYERLRSTLPVFKWEQYDHWCFARFDDVNALLRDRRFGRQILHLASREELGWPAVPPRLRPFYDFEQHSLLELEPPVHTRLRSLVNRAFLSRQVEQLRPKIEALAHGLLDRLEGQGEIDLLPAFATPIPVIVICDMLGVPVGMKDQLLAWSHDMVAMYMARRDEAIERAAVAATLAFSDFMRRHIRERRKNPGDDLLSALIRAEDEGGKLSEDEMVTTAILLLNAGHEATVHAIGNGIKSLLEWKHAGPVSATLVDETLRYDAPLHMFTRYALEDLEYNGLKLRKGEVVGLLLGAANRDEARFAQAERLVADRNPNPHVAFGAGVHFCIGAPLARLELQIALDTLWSRCPGLRLAAEPSYRDSFHFHGLESLRVTC